MNEGRKAHWEAVYGKQRAEETSWFQALPRTSLELIVEAGIRRHEAVIDVGGGASRLIDELLARGFEDLSVLDISAGALEQARTRLESRADKVHWIEADVTQFEPERHYGLWHDRAAFHFLTALEDRRNYRLALKKGLKPGGQLILAAFAMDGPPRCSGLEVVRYDAESLAAELGADFRLEAQRREIHRTPLGREQVFGWYRFSRAV